MEAWKKQKPAAMIRGGLDLLNCGVSSDS